MLTSDRILPKDRKMMKKKANNQEKYNFILQCVQIESIIHSIAIIRVRI